MTEPDSIQASHLSLLLKAGEALSSEKDIDALMELFITTAMALTNADGGTLYRLVDGQQLEFSILHNRSLEVRLGGKSARQDLPAPIPLYQNGLPNHAHVASHAVHTGQTIHIADAYQAQDFDFSGTRASDQQFGYRSQSFLTVPLRNHELDTIGVLQLINAQDSKTGEVIAFSPTASEVAQALAAQAAVALTNRLLIDQLSALFESFIGLVNHAIDDKSPYTGGHCGRVPELTMMLAQAIDRFQSGPLRDFSMSDADRYELKIAGLLHDCGKITTPIHIVDKATKLETIFDRIALIDQRQVIVARELELRLLKGGIGQAEHDAQLAQLADDCAFLRKANIGAESMKPEDIARVKAIAQRHSWSDLQGVLQPFLSDNEVSNLSISAGTLTPEERKIINRHIEVTIAMLEKLPWPKHLRNVVDYAGAHHERMDGKGYPRGLTRDEMPVQARCMAIADVFEALTASDRPYKSAKTLSEALQIMGRMRLNQHLDSDIFDIFIWEKVYEIYAAQFLKPEQIDEVNLSLIPGYTPPAPPPTRQAQALA